MTNDENLLPLPHSKASEEEFKSITTTISLILNKCGEIRVMEVGGAQECLNKSTNFSNSLIC